MKTVVIVAIAVALLLALNWWAFQSHLQKAQVVPLPLQTNDVRASEVAYPVLTIVILTPTTCMFDRENISTSELKARLVDRVRAGKVSLIVKAGKGVPYEAFVPVLDFVRQAGIEEIEVQSD